MMEHTQRTSHILGLPTTWPPAARPAALGIAGRSQVVRAAMYVSSACGNVNAFAAQVELQVGCAGAL
jgi:hypothetical protein